MGRAPVSVKAVLPFGLKRGDALLLCTNVAELGSLLFEAENFPTDTSAFDKTQSPSPTACFIILAPASG